MCVDVSHVSTSNHKRRLTAEMFVSVRSLSAALLGLVGVMAAVFRPDLQVVLYQLRLVHLKCSVCLLRVIGQLMAGMESVCVLIPSHQVISSC